MGDEGVDLGAEPRGDRRDLDVFGAVGDDLGRRSAAMASIERATPITSPTQPATRLEICPRLNQAPSTMPWSEITLMQAAISAEVQRIAAAKNPDASISKTRSPAGASTARSTVQTVAVGSSPLLTG